MNGMNLPVFAQEMMRARFDPRKQTLLAIQSYMFGPEEAVEFGALDQVVPLEQVLETARTTAAMLAQLPSGAHGVNKQAMRQPTLDRIKATKNGY